MSVRIEMHMMFYLLLSYWGSHTLKAQTDSLLKIEIEKIIRYETDISFQEIPGFIIGLVDHDSIFIVPFGTVGKNNSLLIDDTSRFQIGGLTKVFTAHLCQIMKEEGIIDFGLCINRYLPEKFQNIYFEKITVENLLTHTSGLTGIPQNMGNTEFNLQNPYENYSQENFAEYLGNLRDLKYHGNYNYSHMNYALLEIILENQSGMSYPILLEKYILVPNAMTQTSAEHLPLGLTPGYDRSGRLSVPWTFKSFLGSEGIVTTCRDLTLYIRNQLDDDQKAFSFDAILEPRHKIKGSKRTQVAIGWHLFSNKTSSGLYLHSGKTDAHAASIHFVPDTRTAVIMLTNSPGSMDGLATSVLRMLNNNWKRKS